MIKLDERVLKVRFVRNSGGERNWLDNEEKRGDCLAPTCVGTPDKEPFFGSVGRSET